MRSTVSSTGQITLPDEVRERLGLVPGTPVEFELREEGLLLRKGAASNHPVDQVWATLHLGRPVDEVLDEMRGPRREEATGGDHGRDPAPKPML